MVLVKGKQEEEEEENSWVMKQEKLQGSPGLSMCPLWCGQQLVKACLSGSWSMLVVQWICVGSPHTTRSPESARWVARVVL